MKITNREIGIYSGLAIVAGAVSFLVINRFRNERVVKLIIQELQGNAGYGGLLDFREWFSPAFVNDVKSKNASKNILLMTDARITDARTKLKNAWGGTFGDDDEDSIYSVLRSLRNGVELSQVAGSYQKNYGINLLDEITSKLSTTEQAQVASILSDKKPFQYS